MLIRPDVLTFFACEQRKRKNGTPSGGASEFVTHSDDLEDGEEDGRRRHRWWELQHA